MLEVSAEQVKDLGDKLVSFCSTYSPARGDAVLFIDTDGKFGFSAGPDAPPGCHTLMDRAGVDQLMVRYTFVPPDLDQDNCRNWFVHLICEHAWLT